ncbi:MAG: protein kinase, partial [Planctomycetaceae bacterium]|nr:protein kinase [Planctomycetaceae bacterium]
MNKASKESAKGGPDPSRDFPSEEHDTRSLSDDVTFGDQPDYDPQSLGDEVTFGDSLGGSESELFDDNMEIVDLETRYTIESTLGKGGMGEVLLATDTRLNRKVAIKRILGSATRSKTAVKRFLIEAQSIAALNHPNIVQIFDYGRAKDGPFLIMEYVEGNSLLDRCREGAIPAEESIDLICQLCDGLGTAHASNIIHRDIKPANILMTPGNVPKLTDFGLAKDEAADTGMTMQGAVLGTLDFMPPEQRKDAALTDARSDLWSLAATLYQMLTGESPRVIDLDEVPSNLRKCVGKALKTRKDDRYQTALDLRQAIQESSSNRKIELPPTIELGAGECPKCHTRNESQRKFCRECAASLRAPCLGCQHEIPIWDKVCGECGAKQLDLIAARQAEYEQLFTSASQLVKEYRFEAALSEIERLLEIEDERFLGYASRANDFIEQTNLTWEREQATTSQKFEQAQKHRQARDYSAAIKTLESVPAALSSVQIVNYLEELKSDKAHLRKLYKEIKRNLESKNWMGLLDKVNQAIELGGQRRDLQRLREKLNDRKEQEAKIYERAIKIWDHGNGDAKKAQSLLQRIRGKEVSQKDNNTERIFADAIDEVVLEEKRIVGLVKKAQSYGSIDAADLKSLIVSVKNFLLMNPGHRRIKELYPELLRRGRRRGIFKVSDVNAPKMSKYNAWRYINGLNREPAALTKLAELYEGGGGLERSNTVAIRLYREAENLGSAEAKLRLGVLHEVGIGVEQSGRKAKLQYCESALLGNPEGEWCVGRMHEFGRGFVQSYQEAFKFYEQAASKGSVAAKVSLARMYANGLGVEKSDLKARELFDAVITGLDPDRNSGTLSRFVIESSSDDSIEFKTAFKKAVANLDKNNLANTPLATMEEPIELAVASQVELTKSRNYPILIEETELKGFAKILIDRKVITKEMFVDAAQTAKTTSGEVSEALV